LVREIDAHRDARGKGRVEPRDQRFALVQLCKLIVAELRLAGAQAKLGEP
jgi:hypothetical protein